MTLATLLATGAPLVSAQTNSQDDYEKASSVASSYHSVNNDEVAATVAEAQKIKDGGDSSVTINKLDPIVKKVYSGAEYEKAKKEIADELAKVAEKNKASIKAYQDAISHNAKEKKRILEEEEEIKAKFPLLVERDGVRVYGKFNEEARGTQDYYKDIHVFVDDETSTMFKDGVYVHEDSQFVPLEGDKQTVTTLGNGRWQGTYANMSSDDANPKGTKVKITHVADTTDGRQVDVIVTVKEFDFQGGDITLLKQVNEILGKKSATEGYLMLTKWHDPAWKGVLGVYSAYLKGVDLHFEFVDKDNQPVESVMSFVHTDIDYGQGIGVFNTDKIIDLVPENTLRAQKYEVNGRTYDLYSDMGANKGNVDDGSDIGIFNEESSIPDGSFATVIKGSSFSWRHNSWRGHFFKTQEEANAAKNSNAVEGKPYDDSRLEYAKGHPDMTNHMYADIFGKGAKVNLHLPDNAKVPTLEVTEQVGEVVVETIGVSPEKHAYNSNDLLIDGKSVLKGSEIRYGVTADYDAYKGLPKPEKPFTPVIIDDIPEDIVDLTIYNKVVAGGKDITDEMERHVYESIDEAPDYIKEVAKDKVSGKFVAWTPKDAEAYTTNYILTGTDVTAYIGALPKENIINTAIVNKGMQIDFQGLHAAKPVENKVIVPKPEKSVKKAGEDINEKSLLQGTVFNYEFKWSLAEYKDIALPDAKSINLFAFIDDIQDDALDLTETPITIKDGDTDISDKFEIIKTKDGKFGQFTEVLGDNKVEGEGFAIVAKDTNAFLQDYVLKGKDLTITVEAKVAEDFDGTIENEGKQIDFNNKGVTVTNKVRNKTPEFKPVKDVKVGDKSVDGSSVDLDSEFNYVLSGDIMKAETIGDLKTLSLVDNYNEEFDQLTNINKVTAKTDIKLKDGSVIKAGEDITKFATFKDDKGVLTVEFAKDFVEKIADRQDASIEVSVRMKRIKASEKVENTYDLIVNGHKVTSNTVVTKTPNKALPSTGSEIGLTVITVVAAVAGGYIYIGKRKQAHSK
jgi:adhesin isopeptide-forming family sspB-C2 type protein